MLNQIHLFSFLSILLVCNFTTLVQSLFLKYGQDCVTPTNEIGKCISINSCPKALNTLIYLQQNPPLNESLSNQLREVHCGLIGNIPYVCCPKDEVQINPKTLEYFKGLQCGTGSQNRIANGVRASITSYRWMVLLKYNSALVFQCDGSLISDMYVLTAAHCFYDEQNFPYAVRLGEYNLETEEDCTGSKKSRTCIGPYEEIGIQYWFMPHEYVRAGLYHDIALIRLMRKVQFRSAIRPICLPISDELRAKEPESYTVAGWGRDENGVKSNVLLEATIPNQSLAFCQTKLHLLRGSLNNNHICAGGVLFRDSCKGDSGGPLFSLSEYSDGTSRLVQFGIVSLGVTDCGLRNVPAIYTNVSHYMHWILDHIVA